MEAISVNQFRTRLKECVDTVVDTHNTLKVTRRNGDDFIIIGADDWERHKETLYILQDKHLMKQIDKARESHGKGYQPTTKELHEIIDV